MIQCMDNLVCFGDLHLSSRTPSSRIDDYSVTSVEKLHAILDLCVRKSYKHVVFPGDIFHTPIQPISYINEIIDVLKKFKEAGINVYAIYGNHCLTHNSLDYAMKSATGLLFKTGYLKELRSEYFVSNAGYSIGLHGYHYPETLTPVMALDTNSQINICVAHKFYKTGHKIEETLRTEEVRNLGYNIYILGHDHVPYELVHQDDSYIVRPGRVMRGTSDNYNLEDTSVYADIIHFGSVDGKPSITVTRQILPTKTAMEVFNIHAINKDNTGKVLEDLSDKVATLLDMMDIKSSYSSNEDIYEILDSLDISIKIKERIEMYLQAKGIYREQKPL